MSVDVELSGLEVLSPSECTSLLAQGCVGRVGFVAGGRPYVLPVNYAADSDGTVVFRTGASSLLAAASRQEVAFEVDGVDVAQRTGWSVCTFGPTREITGGDGSHRQSPAHAGRRLLGARPPGALAGHHASRDQRAPPPGPRRHRRRRWLVPGHPGVMADEAVDGRDDLQAAVDLLGERLPPALRPLADLAYNYWWSWQPAGRAVFAQLDARRWGRCGHNPVRFLLELPSATLAASAGDGALVERVHRLAAEQEAMLAAPPEPGRISAEHPVAFLCAEFGVHSSLPIYSGGLGVLAGDLLKQASDDGFAMVGVGLLYRTGYFHQRLDVSGYQHEYWTELEPGRSPCVPVTGPDGAPLRVTIPIANEDVERGRVAGGGRSGAALPARHRCRGEHAGGALGDLPALRRQPGAAPGAVRSARPWWRAGARGARHPAVRVPPERRASGTGHGRARRGPGRDRDPAGPGLGSGPALGRVHDAHPGGCGQRDLSGRRVPVGARPARRPGR